MKETKGIKIFGRKLSTPEKTLILEHENIENIENIQIEQQKQFDFFEIEFCKYFQFPADKIQSGVQL